MYLDNNASTPVDPEIIKLFHMINRDLSLGNPHSSEHSYGWRAAQIIEDSQEIVGNFLNALPEEIYFTSGATESNNLAIIGTGLAAQKNNIDRNEVIVSAIEHKCVLNAANFLKEFHGFKIIEVPVNGDGILNLDKLRALINEKTLLVSIMAVNNEIGTQQPLKEIGSLCRAQGSIFHVDAAQGVYSNLDVITNNIDMLSLSGHKMYAPKGAGVLFISEDLPYKPIPLMNGGGQQNGLRAGTLSPALCSSIAKAVEILIDNKEAEIEYLSKLREQFVSMIKNYGIEFTINGDMEYRHPGNLNIQFPNIDAGVLITRLQPHVAISTGSACNAGVVKSSYVLKAIGLNKKECDNSVRIGFGRFNSSEEVKEAAKRISKIISELSN